MDTTKDLNDIPEAVPERFIVSKIIIKKKPAKTTNITTSIQDNASYLDDVASFIKLNYRCPKGTYDEGFSCVPSEKEKADTDKSSTKPTKEEKADTYKLLKATSIVQDAINKKREVLQSQGSDPDNARIEMRTYDSNLLGILVNERPSEEYKSLAKSYGIKNEQTLETAWHLINNISKGDQDASRERIYAAFDYGGDLKKALELQIAVETTKYLSEAENYSNKLIKQINEDEERELEDLHYNIENKHRFSGPDGSEYSYDNQTNSWSKDYEKTDDDSTHIDFKLSKKIEDRFNNKRESAKKEQFRIYRKGNYHENTIESYTTNPEGANMQWMTNPDAHIGTDFSLTVDEVIKDGWVVLTGINTFTGYVGEGEVVLINLKDIANKAYKRSYDAEEVWDKIQSDEIQEDAKKHEWKLRNQPIIKDAEISKLVPTSTSKGSLSLERASEIIKVVKQLDEPFYGDIIVENLAQETGYNKNPVIISSEHANQLSDSGNIEVFRRTNIDDSKMFRIASYYPDRDEGFLATDNPKSDVEYLLKKSQDDPGDHISKPYQNLAITRIIIPKTSKIIDQDELQKLAEVQIEELDKKYHEQNDIAWHSEDQTIGEEAYEKANAYQELQSRLRYPLVAAMVNGYDVVKKRNQYYIINRGAVYVQKQDLTYDKINDFYEYTKQLSRLENSKYRLEEAQKVKPSDESYEDRDKEILYYTEEIQDTKDNLKGLRQSLYGSSKQDSAYLDDAASFIKLNYRCPKGTYDEGFSCVPTKEETKESDRSKTKGPKITKVSKKDLEIVSQDTLKDYEFLHNDFKKTEAIGYTLKNGLNIVYPSNPKVQNLLPMEDLLDILAGLPKTLVSSVKQIEIADIKSPQNKFDEAELSGSTVTLWSPSRFRITTDNLGNTGLIIHELSHAFDGNPPEWFKSSGTSSLRHDYYIEDESMDSISGSIEWENARKSDNKPWVTSYAKSTGRYNEDFAESMTLYLLKRSSFEKKFPNRAKFISKLLDERNAKTTLKHDSDYLDDVASFIKLNYNCPDSEKVGSGPGSCSGGKAEQSPKERLANIDKTLSDLDNQIIEHIRLGNTLDINNADEKTKTEYRKKSSELQSKKHELEVEKALLTFKEPKGPQRKSYNKLVEISEATRNSTYPEVVANYVASSTFMTHELINRPDMKREVLSEAEFDDFQKSNNLMETRWHGPTHNAIAKLDEVLSKSKLPEDMTLYTGISKDLWDQIPKEPNSEFKNITFLSTTIDPKIAKGFASLRKKNDHTKPKQAYYAEIRAKSGTPGIATEQAALRQNPLGTWIIGEGGKPGAGGSQQEVILNRGQHYKVVGVEDEGKFKKIIMETI